MVGMIEVVNEWTQSHCLITVLRRLLPVWDIVETSSVDYAPEIGVAIKSTICVHKSISQSMSDFREIESQLRLLFSKNRVEGTVWTGLEPSWCPGLEIRVQSTYARGQQVVEVENQPFGHVCEIL